MSELAQARGEGRWADAAELAGDDPLLRADVLNEQALFTGSAGAREAASRELDRAEARLLAERGRVLHAAFLAERGEEDPLELEHFEASLELARRAGDERLEAWARFWIGIVHQVVREDGPASLPHFEAAYTVGREAGDSLLASYAIRHLAFAWYEEGRVDEAWRGFEESVELRRAEGFLPGVAAGLLTLAEVAQEQGRADDARRLLAEARESAERCGAEAFLRRIETVEAELA
jgi:tetratricopeptide (TPR) repeat protein